MTNWFRRVWYLLNRRRHERELVAEMHEHRGLMHDPANFGDTQRLLEQSRDAWGWNWLDDAVQDLKLGIRGLMRAPAFAITAVLILTFGIGLNLTLYQMANVGLLRPPDITSPETLARFKRKSPGHSTSTVPYPFAQLVERENTVLSAVLLENHSVVVWGGEQLPVTASFVSPNWFAELGGASAQGRLFAEGVDSASSVPVAVVTHQFWRARLGADPNVVGRTVNVNRVPVTVIGITAREFIGTDNDQPSVYLVLDQREHVFPDSAFLRSWEAENTGMYGRLKQGVTPEAARDSLRALLAALRQERPDQIVEDEWLDPAMGSANFMDQAERRGIVGALSLLGFLTTLVLVVAASNVGNLVLSRATGRSRELGVRVALGANRGRIVRQLVIETLPLAMFGAIGGIMLASWAANLIGALGGLADNINLSPDWRTIGVAVAMSMVALMVIGAIPAWKVARQELMAAIKDGGQQVSISLDKARLRRFMMAAQVCGSCLILVLAAMMTRTLQRVLSDDLGFKYDQAAVLEPGLGRHGFDEAGAIAYWNAVKARVKQRPETASLALALAPPLGRRIRGNTYEDAPGLEVVSNSIEPAFFEVMEIPLVLGRTFQAGDDPRTTVIVSRSLAMAMFGSLEVLGRGFPRSKPEATIVGVAGDAHAIKVEAANTSELYRPLAPAEYVQAVLIARARGDAATLAPVLREAAALDSRLFPGVGLLRDSFERRLTGTRVASGIAVSTGLLTLIIACLGIFGVVSYGATLRVKEFGIHLALGAESKSIVRLVVRNIVWPVGIGMGLGVTAAGPIGAALSSGPIQVAAADPAAYAGALALFVVAALTAAMLPAIRVLKSDPIQSLRHS
jgi:predicted permease